jgi:hypothetical protein
MNCAVSGLHPRSRSSSLATPSAMPSVMIQHQLQKKLIGAWRGLAPIISAVMTPIGARSAAHGWQQTKHWRFVSMSPLAVPTTSARNLASFHAMTGSGSHIASNIRRVDTMMRLSLKWAWPALSTKKGRVSVRWDRRLNGNQSRRVLEWQGSAAQPLSLRTNLALG